MPKQCFYTKNPTAQIKTLYIILAIDVLESEEHRAIVIDTTLVYIKSVHSLEEQLFIPRVVYEVSLHNFLHSSLMQIAVP